MSEAPSDNLNIREQIMRIDRNQAEMQKLFAEALKLSAEQSKLAAETTRFAFEERKLDAETAKLTRDRAFAPWQLIATLMASGAALFGAGIAFSKLLGT